MSSHQINVQDTELDLEFDMSFVNDDEILDRTFNVEESKTVELQLKELSSHSLTKSAGGKRSSIQSIYRTNEDLGNDINNYQTEHFKKKFVSCSSMVQVMDVDSASKDDNDDIISQRQALFIADFGQRKKKRMSFFKQIASEFSSAIKKTNVKSEMCDGECSIKSRSNSFRKMFKKKDERASQCSKKCKSVKVPKKSGRKAKTTPNKKEEEECKQSEKRQSIIKDDEYDSDGEIVLRKSERSKYRQQQKQMGIHRSSVGSQLGSVSVGSHSMAGYCFDDDN